MAILAVLHLEQWCRAEEKASYKPLFSIKLEHAFPQPRETFDEIKNLILEHYYSEDITAEALYWAAIQGMLRDIKVFDVTLKRKKFETRNLIVTKLTDTVALVEIKKFTADLSMKLKGDLKKLKEEGIKSLIIDLRNNPGGVFVESLRVAELFLQEKRILLKMEPIKRFPKDVAMITAYKLLTR